MPTYLEQLTTTRDQVAANLAAITASPKPDYTIDGQTVSWQALFESYLEQLAALEARIAAADPFEEHSQGFT
jgi:hypothetical protein